MNFFRENDLLIAHRVKHGLGNSNFDKFGANLRKFYLFGIKVGLHKSFETFAQTGTETSLQMSKVYKLQPLIAQQ